MARFNPTFTEEELQNEEWKAIPNLHEYEVSSLGQVRRPSGLLVLHMLPSGYVQTRLPSGRPYVHALVLAAFIGPRPKGNDINHKDFVRSNNRLANLEYLTHRENIRYSHISGRYDHVDYGIRHLPSGDNHWSRRNPSKVARGERSGPHTKRASYINGWLQQRKLSDDDIAQIRSMLAAKIKQRTIAQSFNVSASLICQINRGRKRNQSITTES